MESFRFSRTLAVLGTLASAAWAGQAYAVEPGTVDPHEPGVLSGVPAGAVPPPGFYFFNNLNYVSGSLAGGNGNINKAPFAQVNITAWVEIPTVEWVPPVHILGAQYAAAITQPIVTTSTTQTNLPFGLDSVTKNKTGLDNLLINPLILSWHLPDGFFLSFSLPIGLKTGDNESNAAGGTSGIIHEAANNWIFGPSLNLAWFNGHGTELTLNSEFDIQTQDDNFLNVAGLGKATYQSGDFVTLDFGATQALPGAYKNWTLGAIGTFATQLQDDTIGGSAASLGAVGAAPGTVPANFLNQNNSKGSRVTIFGLGPTVAYNFGPVGMSFYYTYDLIAQNTVKASTVWWVIAVPL
jgi:hypothetical protein